MEISWIKGNTCVKFVQIRIERHIFTCFYSYGVSNSANDEFRKIIKILIKNGVFSLFFRTENNFPTENFPTALFYKQPVYKQLPLVWQIDKQLSGLNPLSQSNGKNYRLKKVSLCNKRKIAVKPTIHQNSSVSKALLGIMREITILNRENCFPSRADIGYLIKLLKVVNYFRKKAPSKMFEKALRLLNRIILFLQMFTKNNQGLVSKLCF